MKVYKNISEYISVTNKAHVTKLKEMRFLVKKLVPNGVESIKYGMPTIELNGKNFVHFAAMKGHLGFYPAPSGVKAVEKELVKIGLKFSKGCIQFSYDKPLIVPLITKVIKFRLKEEKER